MDRKSDVVIVGGGLSGTLMALKLLASKPGIHVLLVEEASHLGGDTSYFFHEQDLHGSISKEQAPQGLPEWLQPLIYKTWSETTVRFPRVTKNLNGRYHAIRAEDLHKYAMEKLGDDVLLNKKALRLSESHVELEGDQILSARCIIDARFEYAPIQKSSQISPEGYFKFIGLDLELEKETPHGYSSPILMDTACPQLDGMRFLQIHPWDEHRFLIHESFYSDSPELNQERITRSLRSFVERRGWKIKTEHRKEYATIAIPLTSEYLKSSVGGEALPIGMRAGYLHATTGKAVIDAIWVAEFIASLEDLSTQNARDGLIQIRRPWLSRQRFFRLFNRWLFCASEPSLRYTLFQHIYDQPGDFAEHFFSGKITWSDRLRFLSVRPPIPLDRVMRSLTERSANLFQNVAPAAQKEISSTNAEQTRA